MSAVTHMRREITARMENATQAIMSGAISYEDYLRAAARVAAYRECLDLLTQAEVNLENTDDA